MKDADMKREGNSQNSDNGGREELKWNNLKGVYRWKERPLPLYLSLSL